MKEILREQEISQNPTLHPQEMEIQTGDNGIAEGQTPIPVSDLKLWAESGLDIAITSVERVKSSLLRSAELFREEEPGISNRFFVQCIEGLQRFMEAVTRTKTALKIDLSKIPAEGGTLADTESSLLFILKGMFQNQERKEYEEIADKIEYELLTNLCAWTNALNRFRQSLTSGN